jgi:hypothetical protein
MKNSNQVNIPYEVKEFAKMDWKKFKKKNKGFFDSKKEAKHSYCDALAYDLQYVIEFLVAKRHIQSDEIQEIKQKCYAKIAGCEGEDFVKYLTKEYKKGSLEDMQNLQYLPILLYEMIADINRENSKTKAENPEASLYDTSDLYELAESILSKKLKKLVKKGINENLAFDLLCVVPDRDAMKKFSPFFRVRTIFEILYNHASTEEVDFAKIISSLLGDEYNEIVIKYALQERKEKYSRFNEKQKALFNSINEWVFTTLEDSEKVVIKEIINNYVETRIRDAKNGKDGNRRYFISSLPESLYPRICKVVENYKSANPEAEKFL